MADEETVTYNVWLVGGGEPLLFKDFPLSEAQELQRKLIEAFEGDPNPAGSVSMPDGTLIRWAAIAATQIALKREREGSTVRVLT